MKLIDGLTVLEKANELLSPPGSWTQKVAGRDEFGDEVDPADDACVARCATGVIEAAASKLFGTADPGTVGGRAAERAYQAVYEQLPFYYRMRESDPECAIPIFNDKSWRTHGQIRRLLQRATAAERVHNFAA